VPQFYLLQQLGKCLYIIKNRGDFEMWHYVIESGLYKIEITGGSVKIIDKITNILKKEFKGYTNLYTGAIRPDEKEFFALENGKHFYVYSLKKLELKQRVTLPRTYESIDVCGFYSEQGKTINIPAERYVYDNKEQEIGHYEYVLFKYSSTDCTLIEKIDISDNYPYLWGNIENWITANNI